MGLFQYRTEHVGQFMNANAMDVSTYPKSIGNLVSVAVSDAYMFIAGSSANALGRLAKNLVWADLVYPAGFDNTSGRFAYDRVTKRLVILGKIAAQARVAYSDDDGDTWTIAPVGVLPAVTPSNVAAHGGVVVVQVGNTLYTSVDNAQNFNLLHNMLTGTLSTSRIRYYESSGLFSISTSSTAGSRLQSVCYSADGVNWVYGGLGAFPGQPADANPNFLERLGGRYYALPNAANGHPARGVLIENVNLNNTATAVTHLLPAGGPGLGLSTTVVRNGVLYFGYSGILCAFAPGYGVRRIMASNSASAFTPQYSFIVLFNDRIFWMASNGFIQVLEPPLFNSLAM